MKLLIVVFLFAVLILGATASCPSEQQECENHCKAIEKDGGFCGGPLKKYCVCYQRLNSG